MTKTLRPNSKPYFIDLFSGAGGLSCGLEMAGYHCLLGVDHDKWAIETFKQNHPKATAYCGRIEDLSNRRIRELTKGKQIEIVCGGPPCQGFSTVGPGNPKDTRNKLFREFVRVVKCVEPNFIVIENVTGLLAKKNEQTLKNIFKCFEDCGYHLDVKVMHSEDYGVPEKRRRTIIIGSRLKLEIEFPKATHNTQIAGAFIPAMTIGEAFRPLKTKQSWPNHDLTLAKIFDKIDEKRLARVPEGKGIRYQDDEKTFLPPSLRLKVDWRKLPEGRFRQSKYQRLDRKKPAPTIMTHRQTYYHPTENRYLTPREAACVQSFPLGFEFKGPMTAQWRQIGNAVPPLMAKAIGKALKAMSRKNKKLNSQDHLRHQKLKKNTIGLIRSKAFHYREKAS